MPSLAMEESCALVGRAGVGAGAAGGVAAACAPADGSGAVGSVRSVLHAVSDASAAAPARAASGAANVASLQLRLVMEFFLVEGARKGRRTIAKRIRGIKRLCVR